MVRGREYQAGARSTDLAWLQLAQSPCPSCPQLPSPKVNTAPLLASRMLCRSPAATCPSSSWISPLRLGRNVNKIGLKLPVDLWDTSGRSRRWRRVSGHFCPKLTTHLRSMSLKLTMRLTHLCYDELRVQLICAAMSSIVATPLPPKP